MALELEAARKRLNTSIRGDSIDPVMEDIGHVQELAKRPAGRNHNVGGLLELRWCHELGRGSVGPDSPYGWRPRGGGTPAIGDVDVGPERSVTKRQTPHVLLGDHGIRRDSGSPPGWRCFQDFVTDWAAEGTTRVHYVEVPSKGPGRVKVQIPRKRR